jgi:predicted transcriptional regulator/rubrerythrin
MPKGVPGTRSEERLIPIIRARLAEKLAAEGFRVNEIASALNVTQAAVTQYLKKKRGTGRESVPGLDGLIDPVAEKLVKRLRSKLGPIETVELLDAARQLMAFDAGRTVLESGGGEPDRDASLVMLRERLKLELSAAEKYLELANETGDDHVKLLLRMIASDSIKHADVVSQVISWLEADADRRSELPSKELLESMLSMEDSAKEESLQEGVKVDHPIARLLLTWIDMDEAKHGKMVSRMLALDRKRPQTGRT